VPRSQLIYDCMDNHHGFLESGSQLPAAEQKLIEASDAVVVTSNHIASAVRPLHAQVPMIRNACAPDHFVAPTTQPRANQRPVIGYFGAIAEWFDAYLVEQVAQTLTDCDFLLVGGDTASVQAKLCHLPNVQFTGEVDYQDLPQYVHRMDVLLIPFLINELTLATNPVKAYEALAAGKPVVATPMPELMDTDLAPFVRTGSDPNEITTALRAALAEAPDQAKQQQRVEFARQQTWSHRAEDLMRATADLPKPRVAVVIVTWNGVDLSRRCVRSVLDDPLAPELDVIVVDNASSDATPAWLDEIESEPRIRIIRNSDNLGFAAACNQGLAAGADQGADMLVILNNDIVVTPGWAATLHRHMQHDASIGLIGPVTNNIGNEAKIDTAYDDLEKMQPEQRSLTGRAAGKLFEIRVLAFFCVAMSRDVYEQVGSLDENFGTGFFEDDDYCQRVRQIDRRIVCAEDVFVHHELSASFGKLPSADRQELFDRNKAYYESKWGPWQRHAYRPKGTDHNVAAG
jgi:GT2 family glycosyltransferase